MLRTQHGILSTYLLVVSYLHERWHRKWAMACLNVDWDDVSLPYKQFPPHSMESNVHLYVYPEPQRLMYLSQADPPPARPLSCVNIVSSCTLTPSRTGHWLPNSMRLPLIGVSHPIQHFATCVRGLLSSSISYFGAIEYFDANGLKVIVIVIVTINCRAVNVKVPSRAEKIIQCHSSRIKTDRADRDV